MFQVLYISNGYVVIGQYLDILLVSLSMIMMNASTQEEELPLAFNQTERVVATLYASLLLIIGTFLNTVVIYLTQKHKQFRKPYMYIRSVFACVDIAILWGISPLIIMNVHWTIPSTFTCFYGDFGYGMFMAATHLTALLAIERYVLFCKPFLYNRMFTLKSITLATSGIVGFAQGSIYASDIISGRHFMPLIFSCQIKGSKKNTFDMFNLFIYFLMSIVAISFSIFKIMRLMQKVESDEAIHTEPRIDSCFRNTEAKKAIR